ncbi:MAG: FG-GAP-like repeat-containing protein, partial [Bacteroidota bacterium]
QQTEAHYLKVRLKGKAANTYGIGASVRVHTQDGMQTQRLVDQRGFQSGPEPILIFGLGANASVERVEVDWLGGEKSVISKPPADQLLTIDQQEAKATAPAEMSEPPGMFIFGANRATSIYHRESPYNDFKFQRLLPRKYSTEGPAIGRGDLNGDGIEDYFIAGNASTTHWVLRGAAQGLDTRLFRAIANYQEDGEVQDVLLFDANGDGHTDVYLARGSNEYPADDPRQQDRLFLNDGKGKLIFQVDALPPIRKSSHVIAPHDLDGDGDLDLFIGVNIVPGDYGQLPTSYLLRNDGGTFREATEEWAPELAQAGRVNAAIWTDFDQDGDQDLMLAGEWMPLTFMRNEGGKLSLSRFSTLSHSNGWYQSLISGDFDGDGDEDYIAGNWGLNSIFRASQQKPMSLLSGDFDNNGSIDPVIFHHNGGTNAPFANRDLFLSQMPEYNNRFFTFERYAEANWNNLFTPEQKESARLEQIFELRSLYVENLGRGEFRLRALPNESQMSPVFAIIHDDFNGDGNLDLILGGQFRGNHYEYGPIDASRGLMLAGDGKGGFAPLSLEESGIDFEGEVRDIIWVKKEEYPFMLVANNGGMLQRFVKK